MLECSKKRKVNEKKSEKLICDHMTDLCMVALIQERAHRSPVFTTWQILSCCDLFQKKRESRTFKAVVSFFHILHVFDLREFPAVHSPNPFYTNLTHKP